MSDLDLKNECMEDAEIDLTRYSNSELTQIREAMRMYAERKLKLFAIPDVVWQSEQLKCPKCGSNNKRVYNLKTLKCDDCGEKWAF